MAVWEANKRMSSKKENSIEKKAINYLRDWIENRWHWIKLILSNFVIAAYFVNVFYIDRFSQWQQTCVSWHFWFMLSSHAFFSSSLLKLSVVPWKTMDTFSKSHSKSNCDFGHMSRANHRLALIYSPLNRALFVVNHCNFSLLHH